MKYAKLDEKNIVIQTQPNKQEGFIEVEDNVICGMVKDGDNFIIPDIIKEIIIPKSISMRQARLELLNQGKLSIVENTINLMTGTDGEKAKISWNYSSSVQRNEPLVDNIGVIIGMTSEEIDTMFINAEKL